MSASSLYFEGISFTSVLTYKACLFVCPVNACHVLGESSLVMAHRVQGASGNPSGEGGSAVLAEDWKCASCQGLKEAQDVCGFGCMWKGGVREGRRSRL